MFKINSFYDGFFWELKVPAMNVGMKNSKIEFFASFKYSATHSL